jgi:hypothetical protein
MPDQYRRNPDDDRRDRGWTDRAGDEVRSWLGDDEARARRGNDERNDRHPYGGERDHSWQGQSEGGYSREPRPWRSEERGQGWERNGPQGGQYGRGGQYGSSTYDRGSYGRGQQSDWERRGDDRSWNRGSDSDWESGRGDRSSGATQGDSRWSQSREPDYGSRSSFGGYGTGGYRSGRNESGSYSGYGGGAGSDSGQGMGGSALGGQYGGYGSGSYGGGMGSGLSRESYSGRGPKDYQRSDDRIREEVSDRLTDDHHVDATEISVTVQNGEVTLTGNVSTRDQKRRAEDCAESISGVREVTNNLRVNRQGQGAQDSGPRTSVLGLNEPSTTSTEQKTSQGNTATSTRDQKSSTNP